MSVHFLNNDSSAIQCGIDEEIKIATDIISDVNCIACLQSILTETIQDKDHLISIVDLHHKAYFKAAKRWKEKTGKEDMWPDLSELLFWLLEELGEKENYRDKNFILKTKNSRLENVHSESRRSEEHTSELQSH